MSGNNLPRIRLIRGKLFPDRYLHLIPLVDFNCVCWSQSRWLSRGNGCDAYIFRYDTEGYFGRAEKSPCDYESVMLSGRSVCEGYANVMLEMCK